jgi:putative membrane protein (TIGR04086 family)
MMETRPVALGLIGALASALGLVLAGTLAFCLTPLPERFLPAYAQIIYTLSILIGAALAVLSAGKKGLFYGLAIGALFFCIAAGLALFWHLPGFTSGAVVKRALLSVFAGVVGSFAGAALSGRK